MTPGDELRETDYSGPARSCDIVMKGGITSGVVYPLAVCELARTYRFRNVGGTSAGAIAAAATAAAEYGRSRRGFNELAKLPAWIGADGNLLSLFQPQRSTRRLFAVLIGALEGGVARACRVAVSRHPLAFVAGMLPGLVLLVLALEQMIAHGAELLPVLAALAGLSIACVGAALAISAHLALQVLQAIPDNKYGLCSGGPSTKPSSAIPLTPWLYGLLNKFAGELPAEEPLTFGHLWAGPGKDREKDLPADPDDRHLQLAMMTTNLVNRRAHQLPWESREWLFDPSEFRELFPEEVVRWMEDHPPRPRPTDSSAAVQASRMRRALVLPLLPLPSPADLPVIVATRMSLSFPILLSAVPLWQIDMSLKGNAVLDDWRRWARQQGESWDPLASAGWPAEGQPNSRPIAERCWFSDGGISSNFPVHFFDRLVPRWPTFAINLRPFAPDHERDDDDQAQNTWMVRSNGDGIRDWWHRLPERRGGLGALADKRLFAFLSSAMRTMQNRVDEAQMRVPGYRDRIAHVSMSEDEGGMNLTMPADTISALTERGRAAAELLRDAYTPPDDDQAITWDNHRWVRLRSSLAVLEQMHGRFAEGYSKEPASEGERTYAELLNRRAGEAPKSYAWRGEEQLRLATLEIQAIIDAAKECDPKSSVASNAPSPAPQGRIAPKD